MLGLDTVPVIGKLLQTITETVSKTIPDKDLAAKVRQEIQDRILSVGPDVIKTEIDAQARVLVSEAGGNSWLQRSWRPLLMVLFMVILANDYILAPYLKIWWPQVPILPIPEKLWTLLELGVGGYIASRGIEKSLGTVFSK